MKEELLRRIRDAFPDLAVSTAHLDPEGLANDVLIVNEERVFRFPRDERAREALAREAGVLDLARWHVRTPIPRFEPRREGFVTYAMIPGRPLTRDAVLALPEAGQDRLAAQLAAFLEQLHSIPRRELETHGVERSDAAREKADWVRLLHDIEREVFPFLMSHTIDWARGHFGHLLEGRLSLDHEPVLIHGDLAPYHLLVDEEGTRLQGVIDFGTAGLGDPATDLACIIHWYGESFLRRMAASYQGIEAALDRARFWAGTFELQWALAGLRSNDPSWLLCHLGSAKDARPIGSG